jgi:uncharacterized membrane protein
MMGPGAGYEHHGWIPIVWGLLPALVFVGLIALMTYLFIRIRREEAWQASATRSGGSGDGAVAEARMRYARGEIDRDDYFRISGDLSSQTAAPRPDVATAPSTTAQSPPADTGSSETPTT